MAEYEKLSLNINLMQISSVTAFMNISGGLQSGKKDVYFARCIGFEDECKYIEQIKALDMHMDEERCRGRGGYLRVNRLESQMKSAEVERYAAVYESWLAEGTETAFGQGARGLDFHFLDAPRENAVRESFFKVLAIYRKATVAVSESMTRNFGIKLLSWMDSYLPRIFAAAGGGPVQFPKFVFYGEIKMQEYLFLYLLVCLGCDVLYLNPEKDIAFAGALRELSSCFVDRKQGAVSVPPYVSAVSKAVSGRTDGGADLADNTPRGNAAGEKGTGGESAMARLDRERLVRPPSKKKKAPVQGNAGGPATPPSPARPGQEAGTGSAGRPGSGAGVGSAGRPGSGAGVGSAGRPGSGAGTAFPGLGAVSGAASGSASAAGRPGIDLGAGRRQLSYEELARLSPGIVMISVFDDEKKCFKTGSGVVVSEKGYILTNFHVACQASHYGIRFEEEEQMYETAELIKYNQFYDLAVIRIDKRCTPIPVYKGGKELVRGQKVVAIGSPLGLFNSVSDGIISGFRVFDDVSMIQFTAPISHGSSGGALLNLYGELIGIITAGFDDGQNINLAVDYKTARAFAGGFL